MARLTDRIKNLKERVAQDMASTGDAGRKEVDRIQAERERARQDARRDAAREFREEQREEAAEEARQERLRELRREQQSLSERVADRIGDIGGAASRVNERIPDDAGVEPVQPRRRADDGPLLGGGFGSDEDVLDPLGGDDGVEAGNIDFLDTGGDDGDDGPIRYF